MPKKKSTERVASTTFEEEEALLKIQWFKEGRKGKPSELDVVWFAEKRYNDALRERWAREQSEQESEDE